MTFNDNFYFQEESLKSKKVRCLLLNFSLLLSLNVTLYFYHDM